MTKSIDEVHASAIETFAKFFGSLEEDLVSGIAPGRVNLIGEHTDYNDGYVLPMALPLVTVVVGRKSNSNTCRVVTTSNSVDETKDATFTLDELTPGEPKWANYVKGVVANFHVPLTSGFDAVIATSVPLGGGVSSSASLEVAVYSFLEALIGNPCDNLTEKALACQKAEHEFAGMPCGIMDQFISTMAQEGHALLIDCGYLRAESVPLDDPSVKIVITNSNVRHELTGSEYPTRRKQCEAAAGFIGVKSLRFAKMEDVEREKEKFDEETFRRARHVVGEIERTRLSAEALRARDYQRFGQMMLASHVSLRDDFEVSCRELDELVNIAMSVEGVYGSRMTGGGFGGCTVTLVQADAVPALMEKIQNDYSGNATMFICSAGAGAKFGATKDLVSGLFDKTLAKEIQHNSLADKLICPIVLPVYENDKNEEEAEGENPPSVTVSEYDVDECGLVDSAFWAAFYGRILLQKYEHESQLEILANIQKKLREHEKKQEMLLQSQLEELSLKILQGKEKQEAFSQAWQAESLKALRAHKEREQKYQREFDAVVESIQKQRLEQEAKRVEEENARKKLEEEERQKNQEYAKIVNKVLEEQKRFTTVYKEISDVMKSCPDKKQLVPIATPLLTKLNQSQKAMVQCVSDVKAYETAKAAASGATKAVSEAEEVLAAMKKAVDHLTSEARRNAEKQAIQQQQAAQLKAAQAAERLAAPAQDAGTPALQDQTGKKYSSSSSQPRVALPDDLSRYTELQEFLQRYLEAVKPVVSDPANADLRNKCKLFINTTVNSLNDEDPDMLRDKYEQLQRFLNGKVVLFKEKSISAGKHPVGVQYCKVFLAHKIVEQGEKMVSSRPDSAFGYASFSIALMSEFEDLRNLVYAYFYKQCPYLVPYCPIQQEGQSDQDYYKSLGYVYIDNKVEEQNHFVKRIAGIARLYFAMAVSHLPRVVRNRNPQAQHPMPLHVVFKWMTSVIQLNPVLDVTATLLTTAVDVCGSRLIREHPNEMRQIISYLSQKYLPKIVELGYGAPVSRLEAVLEKVVSTGFVPAPKIISPNFW